jgi:hypothetical protein
MKKLTRMRPGSIIMSKRTHNRHELLNRWYSYGCIALEFATHFGFSPRQPLLQFDRWWEPSVFEL